MSQFEQREDVKFCQKLGKSASETFQMIKQVYSEEALGCSAVFKWHKRFAQGIDSLEDDEHTSLPRTVGTELKNQEDATLVGASRSQTVDEIAAAAAAGIRLGTCYKILCNVLNMSHVTQHSAPCVLMQYQRGDHMSICGELIDSADNDGMFLNRIITGDETLCFLYNPQLKRQSATWKSPSLSRKKKSRQDRSKGKVTLELFFDSSGIVHMEFIPEGVTVNKHHYKEILHCLHSSVHHKHSELWHRKNWLLLHGNAPAHCSVLVQE
jgi:hypothetical protein